jgi:2-haloacid dehalogenase
MALSPGDFQALTFDCYGTLIDWEAGILSSLGRVVREHRPRVLDAVILEAYAEAEAAEERGAYRPYRTVLRNVVRRFGHRFGFEPTRGELSCLEESLGDWPPFPDTVESLRALSEARRIGVISNIDNDLFARTARVLGVEFAWVITAEDAGSYKPSLGNFEHALAHIGLPSRRILHAAQSLYHDIAPAREVGLRTVWVDRRSGREGFGATPQSQGRPDATVRSLEELVELIGAG